MQYDDDGGIKAWITLRCADGIERTFDIALNREQFTKFARIVIVNKEGKILDDSDLNLNRINNEVKTQISRVDKNPGAKAK